MELEKKRIKTMPDAASEEKVEYFARAGARRRREQERLDAAKNYDRLAIYGNILDD